MKKMMVLAAVAACASAFAANTGITVDGNNWATADAGGATIDTASSWSGLTLRGDTAVGAKVTLPDTSAHDALLQVGPEVGDDVTLTVGAGGSIVSGNGTARANALFGGDGGWGQVVFNESNAGGSVLYAVQVGANATVPDATEGVAPAFVTIRPAKPGNSTLQLHYFENLNTKPVRIVFDGGDVSHVAGGGGYWFYPTGGDIVVEATPGHVIKLNSGGHSLDLASGSGTTTFTGGDLVWDGGGSNGGTLTLGGANAGTVVFRNLGDFVAYGPSNGSAALAVSGTSDTNVLPAGEDCGSLSLMNMFAWVNLMGSSQEVNGIIGTTGCCVSNRSGNAANLIVGKYKDGAITDVRIQGRLDTANGKVIVTQVGNEITIRDSFVEVYNLNAGTLRLRKGVKFGKLVAAEGTTILADGLDIDLDTVAEDLNLTDNGVTFDVGDNGRLIKTVEGRKLVIRGLPREGGTYVRDLTTLTNRLATIQSGSTVVLRSGLWDLSEIGYCKDYEGYGRFYLWCGSRMAYVTLKGENEKPWWLKTPDEETVLKGGGEGAIWYSHGGGGRPASFHHLTFENGKYLKGKSYGGGAVVCAASEQYNPDTGRQLATNCVFRSCSSETSGGATYGLTCFDCLYTNCTAASNGGGAYGLWNNNGGKNNHTNIFDRCVFVDCTASYGGGIYGKHFHTATDCVFTGCRATGGAGGAIYAESQWSEITRGAFSNNYAKTTGGAVFSSVVGSGLIRESFFADNTNTVAQYVGSHVSQVGAVKNCTFTGYGNVYGVSLVDMCTFDGCIYPYFNQYEPAGLFYIQNEHGNATIRNSLFRGTVTARILNCDGNRIDVENCTFVTNFYASHISFAKRSGPTGALHGGTNVFVNCIFADNWYGGENYDGSQIPLKRRDFSFYGTASSVLSGCEARAIMSHCLYQEGKFYDGAREETEFLQGNPKFAAGAEGFEDLPYYSLLRGSKARKRGLVLDWMADATDLASNDRVGEDGLVDMGCYESNWPRVGGLLFLR